MDKEKYNLGDAMTKLQILPEFVKAIDTNQMYYEVEQSVNCNLRSKSNEKKKW